MLKNDEKYGKSKCNDLLICLVAFVFLHFRFACFGLLRLADARTRNDEMW